MTGTSTLTQKGQVAIPKSIRDHFGLKPSDKIHFSIQDNKIVAEPLSSLDSLYGMLEGKKTVSKKEMKKVISDAVIAKFKKKNI